MRVGVYVASCFAVLTVTAATGTIAGGCGISIVGEPPPLTSNEDGSTASLPPKGPDYDGATTDGGQLEDATVLLSVAVNANAAPDSGAVVTAAGGVSCPPECTSTVPLGTALTLTASSSPEAVLLTWSGDTCVGREPTCVVTMDAPKTVVATFAPIEIYASSGSALYVDDGPTAPVRKVGDFKGCDNTSVGDIAVARNGQMFAITLSSNESETSELFTVDKLTAKCGPARIGDLGKRCNGLTFAPDPADPRKDVLFASCFATLEKVNLTTGALTLVGPFDAALEASGDVVYAPGFGIFATMKSTGNDRLAKIDPETGKATVVAADLGGANVWGLAFRGKNLLAFGNGTTFTVDLETYLVTPKNGLGFQAYGAAAGP